VYQCIWTISQVLLYEMAAVCGGRGGMIIKGGGGGMRGGRGRGSLAIGAHVCLQLGSQGWPKYVTLVGGGSGM
jgi:hypothetical protein